MFKGIRGDADGNSSRSGLANSLKKLILEQFSEKKILDFIASEIAKVMARTIGWLTLDFVLYGSQNWFSRRRKKREEAQEYLSGNCQRQEGGDKTKLFHSFQSWFIVGPSSSSLITQAKLHGSQV